MHIDIDAAADNEHGTGGVDWRTRCERAEAAVAGYERRWDCLQAILSDEPADASTPEERVAILERRLRFLHAGAWGQTPPPATGDTADTEWQIRAERAEAAKRAWAFRFRYLNDAVWAVSDDD